MLQQARLEATLGRVGGSVRQELDIASEQILYHLGRSVVGLFMHTMLRTDVRWHAPLPDGPKILAANHPTTTDPFFILTLLSEQTSVLLTGGAFETPVFGRYLRAAGHVPVIRNGGGATLRAAIERLKAGRSVAIFPEGALSPLDGGIGFHKPHTGVARLALSTGASVVPVGISLQRENIRTVDIQVDGQIEQGRCYLRGPYAITVGQPVTFEGDVGDWAHVRSVSGRIMQRIIRLSQEGAQRLEPSPAIVPAPAAHPAALASAT